MAERNHPEPGNRTRSPRFSALMLRKVDVIFTHSVYRAEVNSRGCVHFHR